MARGLIPPIEIDNAALGPAMLALTPAMRAFVFAKVFRGFNNKECARWAGYSAQSENSLGVTGHNVAHDPRVQEAIAEESKKLMRSEGANSIRTLIEIRDDPTTEKKDRIKCAVELLNRSGFHGVSETVNHNIETHLTVSQKDQRILQLCAELGLSKDEARKMLVAPSETVIDAAYEDVPDQTAAAEPLIEMTEAEKKEQAARDRRNDLKRQKRTSTTEQWEAHKAEQREERIRRAKANYQQSQQQDDGDTAMKIDDLSDIY